jgi:putative FmdB family regulatory protein
MPTYEYECAQCGHHCEVFQKMSDSALKKCPKCGVNQLKRLIGSSGLIFKGSGFYITDYRSKKYKEQSKSESLTKDKKPETVTQPKKDNKTNKEA